MPQDLIGLSKLRTEPLKTARIAVRLTEEDLVMVVDAARAENLPPTEFARRTLRAGAEAVLAAAQKRKKKA